MHYKHEDKIFISLGVIEKLKRNEADDVRYLIRYKTEDEKEHLVWSNWMRDDGYKVGDSIAVRGYRVTKLLPFNVTRDIDRHPQTDHRPLAVALAVFGVGAAVIGFILGRSSKD